MNGVELSESVNTHIEVVKCAYIALGMSMPLFPGEYENARNPFADFNRSVELMVSDWYNCMLDADHGPTVALFCHLLFERNLIPHHRGYMVDCVGELRSIHREERRQAWTNWVLHLQAHGIYAEWSPSDWEVIEDEMDDPARFDDGDLPEASQ